MWFSVSRCGFPDLGVVFLTLVFEVSWPCSTLTMLLLARKCTWQLRIEAWLLLSPYLLQLLGLLLWRLAPKTIGKPWENGGLMGFNGMLPSGNLTNLRSY